MGHCLITKYQESVSDDSLPILETLQPFTLAAVTASGNENMTEAQVFALNHFFYSIGAIDNSSLWQKIKVLLIPMLCSDVGKAFVNYVDNSEPSGTPRENFTLSNHGLATSGSNTTLELPTKMSGNSWEISSVQLTMGAPTGSSSGDLFRVYLSSSNFNRYGFYATDFNYLFRFINSSNDVRVSKRTKVFDIGGLNVKTTEALVRFKNTQGADFYEEKNTDTMTRPEVETWTNAKVGIKMDGTTPYGLMLIGDLFTDAELDVVMDAVKVFRNSFLSA